MEYPIEKDYAEFVARLFKPMKSDAEYMMHAAIGISGEGGEILDTCKKTWIYNKPLDLENVKEELGDILFYMQAACNFLGISIQDLMISNMEKLNKRYPKGYTDQAAQERADKEKGA